MVRKSPFFVELRSASPTRRRSGVRAPGFRVLVKERMGDVAHTTPFFKPYNFEAIRQICNLKFRKLRSAPLEFENYNLGQKKEKILHVLIPSEVIDFGDFFI